MSQEVFNQEQAQQTFTRQDPNQPQKKSNTGKIITIIVSVVAAIALLAGGGTLYYYVSGGIEGEYHATKIEKEYLKTLEDEFGDSDLDYSKFIEAPKLELKVTNNNVKGVVRYKFDAEAAYDEYLKYIKEEQKEYELSDEDMEGFMPSKEDFIDEFNSSMEEFAKNAGLSYDSRTGVGSGTIFKGKVHRWSRQIEITEINEDFMNQSDNSEELDDFKKGSTTSYTKDSSSVTLSGDKDVKFDKE
ncbi:hypothetical protein ACVR0S_03740 [Streptococcus dentapri]|uniref:Lipoprotein n=1 Tax=Streptococcus dentapri TaxID=573564 RepID=A0ABV8D1S7_9STRE